MAAVYVGFWDIYLKQSFLFLSGSNNKTELLQYIGSVAIKLYYRFLKIFNKYCVTNSLKKCRCSIYVFY